MFRKVAVDSAVGTVEAGLLVKIGKKGEDILAILVEERLLSDEHVTLDEGRSFQVVGKPGPEVCFGFFENREEDIQPLHVLGFGKPCERGVVFPVEELGDDDVRLVKEGVYLVLCQS